MNRLVLVLLVLCGCKTVRFIGTDFPRLQAAGRNAKRYAALFPLEADPIRHGACISWPGNPGNGDAIFFSTNLVADEWFCLAYIGPPSNCDLWRCDQNDLNTVWHEAATGMVGVVYVVERNRMSATNSPEFVPTATYQP